MPRRGWHARSMIWPPLSRRRSIVSLYAPAPATFQDTPGGGAARCPKNKAVIFMNKQSHPASTIKALEQKILQSYVFVLRVNKNAQGYRSSTLERHGAH